MLIDTNKTEASIAAIDAPMKRATASKAPPVREKPNRRMITPIPPEAHKNTIGRSSIGSKVKLVAAVAIAIKRIHSTSKRYAGVARVSLTSRCWLRKSAIPGLEKLVVTIRS
jgi:hypothetical protein